MTKTPEQSIEQLMAGLLYESTTESMIPGDWLRESGEEWKLMTDWERVELLLKAVNGESIPVREWSRLCGAPLSASAFNIAVKGKTDSPDFTVPLYEQAKPSLRAALDGVIREPDVAVVKIEKNAREILRGRVLMVTEEVGGVPRDRVIAHSIGAALVFALRLVLDPG